MGKINVLDFEIANLIAAGEVVERPSSVLKELIENSIDSGATSIVAEIKRGGVALIRVSDNGCGMDKDDLPVAIKRHATSKIKNREDLEAIMTLGFRGEALAAISSVSEVTIITKTKQAECGSMLTSEGGRIIDISEVGCADGTTVCVENLFFNVPARRKFLKKDSTEALNCSALVEKVALSRPDISIQLLIDGEERFKTPGDNKLINAIYAVYGKDFSSKLIKADGTANGVRVHGYIGRSDNVKKNRNYQNIFINGRYVKSLTAMAAIEKAYTSYIAHEAFPTCVLFLDMNPAMVDVNVHPAKLEVKFASEQPVFEAIYYTVKRAIEDFEYRPEMNLPTKNTAERNYVGAFVPIGENTRGEQISFSSVKIEGDTPTRSENRIGSGYEKSINRTSHREGGGYSRGASVGSINTPISLGSGAGESLGAARRGGDAVREPSVTPKSSLELLEKYSRTEARPSDEPIMKEKYAVSDTPESLVETPKEDFTTDSGENIPEYKFVGEAYNCYLLVEYEGDLLVIDKHAAHERVIFEELKREAEKQGSVSSQTLLLPLTVILSPDETAAANDSRAALSDVGFEYTVFSGYAEISAIPDTVSAQDAESLFIEMLDEIIEGSGNPAINDKIRREKALYQIACKAAVKGGRAYDESVTEWIIKKVLSLPDVIVCPHGRPIAIKLTKNELDRQFERIK